MRHWTLHPNRGTRRCFAAAVAVGHKLYSFGGYCNLKDRDQIAVHVFNTVSLRWTKLPPVTGREQHPPEVPSNCVFHTAVLIEDLVYIWGGLVNFQVEEGAEGISVEGTDSNVLYAFDVDAHRWFEPCVSGTVPEGRNNHSASALGTLMFIHGGQNLTRWTNDTNKLDTSTMVWSLINTRGTTPPVSSHHSATIVGTKMFVLFGGGDHGCNNKNNIVRVFDTETHLWLRTPSAQLPPEGRWGHSALAYNGELYIFGGYNGHLEQTFKDVWRFNPETFSWKKVEPKGECPFWIVQMSCCMLGDRIILFRGSRDSRSVMHMLDLNPGLKMLCKLAVIQYGLDQSELPHDIRWELATMTATE